MSKKLLTEHELHQLQEDAEFGEIDHSTASKKQVRILTALHFVLGSNEEAYSVPYTNIETIQKLIERFFGKKHSLDTLIYWTKDLMKRGYVTIPNTEDADEDTVMENFFSLTEAGIALFMHIHETRETLFESNSRNSIAFMH